jgi:GDP-L-fucose synthase
MGYNETQRQPRWCLNTDRAKREFGFAPKTDFRKGLRRTIDWYLSEWKTG